MKVQLSKSSQSKNGGAYFSAVCGSNLVPVSATEGHEHRVCNRLLGFYPPGTFVLPHTCTHHPLIHGRCQQYLFRSRSIGFLSKQIQSTCFWTNTAGNAHGWADDVCMCGAKQKVKDVVPPKKSNLQLSKSSQAKKWGAYFSAVCGWNSVPISATEAHGHRVCNRLLDFLSSRYFFLPHTCTQHPRGHGRFQKDLFRSRSIGFVWWEIHSTCFWTNPFGNAHVLADAVCMCGAKQKYLVDKMKYIGVLRDTVRAPKPTTSVFNELTIR